MGRNKKKIYYVDDNYIRDVISFHKYLPSHDKKIGEEGFDLRTEILDQSRQLKISGAEKNHR